MKNFKTDILVVGAGAAGIAATLSASRINKNVILAEQSGYIGGLITGGLVTLIAGTGNRNSIVKEIIEALGKYDKIRYLNKEPLVHPELFKIVVEQMLYDQNVRLFYRSYAYHVTLDNKRIEIVHFKGRGESFSIEPKIVIDCTGDGDIFYYCKEPFSQYQPEDIPVGLIMRMYIADIDKAEKFFDGEKGKELLKELSIDKFAKTAMSSVVWFHINFSEPHFDLNDPEDLSYVEMRLRKKALSLTESLKKNAEGFESSFLLDTAPLIGVRISRILRGQYILTESDFYKQKKFKDTIATSVLELDGKKSVNIPYRSLLPRNTENLLVAGRCISTDFFIMSGSVRLISTCFATGQAAGIAAALMLKKGDNNK